jgi:hypothetical protein
MRNIPNGSRTKNAREKAKSKGGKRMNYEEAIWAEIYDDYNQGRHQNELKLYGDACRQSKGKCLEVATGTGMIFLPLLMEGIDIYGFDISQEMLNLLKKKAENAGIEHWEDRISQQDMRDFKYDYQFELVIIPARSILHLPTQDDQVRALMNIRNHMKQNGRMILNFFVPSYTAIASILEKDGDWQHNGDYRKFSDGSTVGLYYKQVNNPVDQIQSIEWKFIEKEKETKTKMKVKWIFKDEFQLLLKLAGFSKWNLFGGFERESFDESSREMVWEVYK